LRHRNTIFFSRISNKISVWCTIIAERFFNKTNCIVTILIFITYNDRFINLTGQQLSICHLFHNQNLYKMRTLLFLVCLFILSCKPNAPEQSFTLKKAKESTQLETDNNPTENLLLTAKSEAGSIKLTFQSGLMKDIMDFDPILKNFDPKNKSFLDGKSNYAKIKLNDLKASDKKELLPKFNFFKKDANFDLLDYAVYEATTGPLIIKENYSALLYRVKGYTSHKDYEDEIVGSASIIVVLDKDGKVLKTFEGMGIGLAAITDNSKYLMSKDGGNFGDGGSNHIQDKLSIYNIENGNLIFTTVNLPFDSNYSQREDLFIILDYLETGKKRYIIFDPENRKVYLKEFENSEFKNFSEFQSNGILKKDGSIINFSEWDQLSFKKYNQTQLFGNYKNITEFR